MRPIFSAATLVVVLTQATAVAGPMCALLDPEKTPRVALLEAKLLSDTGTTWVERANIDAVLKEQKLQAMFSPQGVGERVKLGKVLKADVLVRVRPVKGTPEPTLEVVVSETAGGLRLLVRGVPVTKDAEADVAGLLAAVKDGIHKSSEAVKEIVAVPPFVSNNLEFTHDHLRGAFAKLVEAESLDRKGVVVVELAEAEALAKEVALTAPGGKLDRPLPLYLLGEYRNEGKGKDSTISLKFHAERGGKPVGKLETLTLKPEAAPEALRKWAGAVCDTLAKDDKPRPPADPKAEAKQLAERARVFARLGNWVESLALIEASLLLDPDQAELRFEALRVVATLVTQLWKNHGAPKIEDVRRIRPLYQRGLEHLETATFRDDLRKDNPLSGVNRVTLRFLRADNDLYSQVPTLVTKDVIAELKVMRRERNEVLLRMLPDVVKRGKFEERELLDFIFTYLPPKERYELAEGLALQFQDQSRPTQLAFNFGDGARRVRGITSFPQADEDAEARAFLERLAEAKNPHIRTASTVLKQKWEADSAVKKTPAPNSDLALQGVVYRQIEVTTPVDLPKMSLHGIANAGPGVDVVWGDGILYLAVSFELASRKPSNSNADAKRFSVSGCGVSSRGSIGGG